MTYLKHIASLLLALLVFSIASVNATESITYIHTDHLGSPIAATNEDGSVKWTEDYQPFGVQRTNQDSDNTTGFTGHQHDDALDLTYMQARWYHPEVGRFMALDPIVFRTSNLQSFGRYTYGNNNPYRYIDPDGMDPYDIWQARRNIGDDVPLPSSSLSQAEAEFVVQAMAAAIDGPKEFVKSAVKETLGIEIPIPSLRKYVKKELKKAKSSVNGVKLEKQLASEEQLGQLSSGGGTVISQPARQADRIASETGRNASDIQKVSSSAKRAKDGTKIETHSFRDASTNELIEPKTIIDK